MLMSGTGRWTGCGNVSREVLAEREKSVDLHAESRFEIYGVVPDLVWPVTEALVAPDAADVLPGLVGGPREIGLLHCRSFIQFIKLSWTITGPGC